MTAGHLVAGVVGDEHLPLLRLGEGDVGLTAGGVGLAEGLQCCPGFVSGEGHGGGASGSAGERVGGDPSTFIVAPGRRVGRVACQHRTDSGPDHARRAAGESGDRGESGGLGPGVHWMVMVLAAATLEPHRRSDSVTGDPEGQSQQDQGGGSGGARGGIDEDQVGEPGEHRGGDQLECGLGGLAGDQEPDRRSHHRDHLSTESRRARPTLGGEEADQCRPDGGDHLAEQTGDGGGSEGEERETESRGNRRGDGPRGEQRHGSTPEHDRPHPHSVLTEHATDGAGEGGERLSQIGPTGLHPVDHEGGDHQGHDRHVDGALDFGSFGGAADQVPYRGRPPGGDDEEVHQPGHGKGDATDPQGAVEILLDPGGGSVPEFAEGERRRHCRNARRSLRRRPGPPG